MSSLSLNILNQPSCAVPSSKDQLEIREQSLQQAHKMDPKNKDIMTSLCQVLADLAEVYREKNDLETSRAYLLRAIKLSPANDKMLEQFSALNKLLGKVPTSALVSKKIINATKDTLLTYITEGKINQIILDYLFLDFVLCVEVGGTRIKAAILPTMPTLEKLKTVKTIDTLSKPWFNQNLFSLFETTINHPLTSLVTIPHSMTSLTIKGAVYEKGLYPAGPRSGLPLHLRQALECVLDQSVMVENDAISWARGAVVYQEMQSRKISYPVLAITLGTGVGGALLENENSICGLELSSMDCSFSHLKVVIDPKERLNPHITLGQTFFDAFGEKLSNEEMVTVYNKRFYALVEDIYAHVQKLFSVQISSLFVGGGNSRLIEIPENYEKSVTVLSPQILEANAVSPDLIQLLGCQSASQKPDVTSKVYPSYERMVQLLST